MDCDLAKTKTLLYFYEYLMRKGEPQKIAHLSCLFGEKEFTEDMRQIVQRSKAGLKKLLSENPNLFKIVDDELVYLNANESSSSVVIAERDINVKTKDYFTHKLMSYGMAAKVPIKFLHGHRSQAPPQIRHTSGLTTKDFKRFLSIYPATFRIVGNTVLLLGYDDPKSVPYLKSRSPNDDREAVHKINDFHPAPQQHDVRKKWIAETALDKADISCGSENSETGISAEISSVSKVDFENLCEHNCPKLDKIANVFSPAQLCVSNPVQVRKNTQIITTVADSLEVTGKILKFVNESGAQAVVSFNCKGTLLGSYTKLALLELGTPAGQAFLFDVLTCPQIMTDGGVKDLLESDRIVKVIHNCRYQSGNLYEQCKIILKCVFDTQSANTILQYQNSGMQVDEVKTLTFRQLIQLYCPFNSVNELNVRCQWSVRERPFKEEMVICVARETNKKCTIVFSDLDRKLKRSKAQKSIKDENKTLLSVICTVEILAWIHPIEVNAQLMKRNIHSEGAALETKNLRSLTSELDCASHDDGTLQKTTNRRCCGCYVDRECQTLSTGDIAIKGIACASDEHFPQ